MGGCEMHLRPIGSLESCILDMPENTSVVAASKRALGRNKSSRKLIEIYNSSNGTIYLGGKDVGKSNGYPIKKGQVKAIPVNSNSLEGVFLFSETATSIVLLEYYE